MSFSLEILFNQCLLSELSEYFHSENSTIKFGSWSCWFWYPFYRRISKTVLISFMQVCLQLVLVTCHDIISALLKRTFHKCEKNFYRISLALLPELPSLHPLLTYGAFLFQSSQSIDSSKMSSSS